MLPLPRRVLFALLWLTSAVLFACRSDPTQIVVAVNTDYELPAELDSLRLEVSSDNGTVEPITRKLTAQEQRELPITLALSGRGGQRVNVTVSGYLGDELRVRVRASTRFVSERILTLPMNLITKCEREYERCEALGQTCGDLGNCVLVERDNLGGWNGTPSFEPPPFDASTPSGDTSTPPETANMPMLPRDADAGSDAQTPFDVERRIVKLALGSEHSCALRASGELFCWGSDDSGQLGTGGDCDEVAISDCATPQRVEGLDAIDVSAGHDFTCAVARDGTVWCWGPESRGQIGNGPLEAGVLGELFTTPQRVQGLTGYSRVELGGLSACAFDGERSACWGNNKFGQLRTDVTDDIYRPAKPSAFHGTASQIWLGSSNGCAQLGVGLECSGVSDVGVVVDALGDGTNLAFYGTVTSADVGASHACAVQNAKLYCWGRGDTGQLGIGAVRGRCPLDADESFQLPCETRPTRVEAPWPLDAPALGDEFSCAVVREGGHAGEVACWGSNRSNLIDPNEDATVILTPTPVPGLPKVELLAAGGRHACAVTAEQRILCWGSSSKGQLGPNIIYGLSASGPVEVPLP